MMKKNKILLASNNQGKIREINELLESFSIEVIPQGVLDITDAEETGLSFVENALIKARHGSECSGMPAIADDSGLCVEALQGAPGIYSARYAGKGASDKENNIKLLEALKHIPKEQRQAYFYCAMVFVRHPLDPTPIIALGEWHGNILFEAVGQNGFGYDPLFYVPHKQCSSAELDKTVKNALSHRGQALRELVSKLSKVFPHVP